VSFYKIEEEEKKDSDDNNFDPTISIQLSTTNHHHQNQSQNRDENENSSNDHLLQFEINSVVKFQSLMRDLRFLVFKEIFIEIFMILR